MADKTIKTRIQMKNDTAENWDKATGFIPKAGEVIVYNTDDDYNTPRLKIGNGSTAVTTLPFVVDIISEDALDAICDEVLG